MLKTLVRAAVATTLAAIGVAGFSASPALAVAPDLYVSEAGTDAGGCASSASPCATVSYALGLPGAGATIHVSGRIHDHVDINEEVTITGEDAPAGSPAVLDGSGTGIVIFADTGNKVDLKSLRIENGLSDLGSGAAGGVWTSSPMTLTDVTVANNEAYQGGGIYNWYGDLTLIRSTVTGNTATDWFGGGIHAGYGKLTLIDSTVSDNHSPNQGGGGIWANSENPVRIVRSTISGNTATSGGGVYAKTLTVIDSTFTANEGSLGSAIRAVGNGGTALIVGSTISGNSYGPAVFADSATVTLGGTIVSGNSAHFGQNCQTSLKAFVSAGYNLTNDADGTTCGMIAPTDRLGLDPGLGPLQDNGGPTWTRMPSGSGAVQVIPRGTELAGVAGCFGQDQRGYARPQPGTSLCMSGAVEFGTTVAEAPAFTSGSSATVDAGAPVSVPVAATGVPIPMLSASGLPAGVSFVDNGDGTGSMTGSTMAAGSHPITLTATNWVDPVAVQTFTLTVQAVFNPTYVSISDATVVEGNSGARNATFTLTRTGATAGTSSVKVSTTDVSAAAGSDYTALPSTTVSFGAGVTTKTVNVSVNGDTTVEANETLRLNLFSPVAATISDTRGIATIVNDDAASLSVNDVNVTEGDTGTKNVTFTVTRRGSLGGTSSVKVATANGTAFSNDYTALPSTTVSFAAGEQYKSVVVSVKGDTADESNETFQLKLSAPVGATIADDAATATIVDNEGPPELAPETFLSVDDVAIVEGNVGSPTAVVTVRRSGDVSGVTWVDVATADGTATGDDYTFVSGTLMFSPGEKTKTVGITITGDKGVEGDETVLLNLSGTIGGDLSDASATVTVINDDAAYLGVNDAFVAEGNSGTTTITVTLTRTGSLGGASTVKITTADGTATAGSDYTTKTKLVTFAPGKATVPVTFYVTGDTTTEPNETFQLNLTTPTGATIADTSATATIVNDD